MNEHENPVIQKIVQYLGRPLDPLQFGPTHVRSDHTRSHSEYDEHLPDGRQPQNFGFNPRLHTIIQETYIEKLEECVGQWQPEDLDPLFSGLARQLQDIVPDEVVDETTVTTLSDRIGTIAGDFATLGCFKVDRGDLLNYRSAFHVFSSGETNTKADRLVGCRYKGDEHKWGSLWKKITEPTDIRHPFFKVLFPEEYKNILAARPLAFLGILIIIWCSVRGHLRNFWPGNPCNDCDKFRKSHEFQNARKNLEFDPIDGPSIADLFVGTDLPALRKEILRVLKLDAKHIEKCDIPPELVGPHIPPEMLAMDEAQGDVNDEGVTGTALLKRKFTEMATGRVDNVRIYKERLDSALGLAAVELGFTLQQEIALRKWVVQGAYFIVQLVAHMNRHEAVYGRISCHNYDMVFVRQKATQTLVVSNVLENTDGPILRSAALTVCAYKDAVERFDRTPEEHRVWLDPFHIEAESEDEEDAEANEESTDDELDLIDSSGDSDGDNDNGQGGGSNRRRGGGGGAGEGSRGQQGGSGGEQGGHTDQQRSTSRGKGKGRQGRPGRGTQDADSIDELHLAFRAPQQKLWTNGFTYYERISAPTVTAAPGLRFADIFDVDGSRNRGASFEHGRPTTPPMKSSNISRGSVRSISSIPSLSGTVATAASSSPPATPSTTSSFPTGSKESSPLSKKRTNYSPYTKKIAVGDVQVDPLKTTPPKIQCAGVFIENGLNERMDRPTVWSGQLILEDGTDDVSPIPIVAKIAIVEEKGGDENDDEAEESVTLLRHEGFIYELLAKAALSGIPRYYGAFDNGLGTVVLILGVGGQKLNSFKKLSREQRHKLLATAERLHQAGIVHNDLEPCNVVQDSSGEVKIIDFDMAVDGHRCPGMSDCEELAKFAKALALDHDAEH
ncbi:hypothetical protein R3P38DRAFT_2522220 [Favolaschia claudopus]|uniref:Protein kinase domain-containing protein n=1 Tax=Favolaschia claudopus TaxID=2862362 RepID=A0AAW0BZF1_9AGAR